MNQGGKSEKKILCQVWSRVVGFYRPVEDFNVGKQEEFKDRLEYQVPTTQELNGR